MIADDIINRLFQLISNTHIGTTAASSQLFNTIYSTGNYDNALAHLSCRRNRAPLHVLRQIAQQQDSKILFPIRLPNHWAVIFRHFRNGKIHAYFADSSEANAKHNFQHAKTLFHNMELFPHTTKWHLILQVNQHESECGARAILSAAILVAARRPDSAFSSLR
jgi:hypothetical protein